MQHNAVASTKLNALSTASRLKQLDNCLFLLSTCADNTFFPAKESRDFFFHVHEKEHQIILTFTNDHEDLSFEEAVEICEKFEINGSKVMAFFGGRDSFRQKCF